MTDPQGNRGAGALLADVMAGVARLVQGELALARAEAAERLDALRQSVIQGALAVVLGIVALNVLAGAATAGLLTFGVSPVWAPVLVGGLLLVLCLAFAQRAARLLREMGTLPRRGAASVKRDVETLQTLVRRDATS